MKTRRCALVVALLMVAAAHAPAGEPVVGLPLTGEEAIAFLSSAEVVGQGEDFDPVAITGPLRVSMTDGSRTLRAIFKDENTLYPRFRFGDGREVDRVKDSYKHEIAAYELDAMLGIGIIPPCVERTLFSRTGSLCLWVENAITEAERKKKRLEPPNVTAWNENMFLVRLVHQLTWDLDYTNIRNLIVDDNFKVYKVDSSMAFMANPKLRREASLTRFSRSVLEALESVERSELDERLSPWLLKNQLDALWKRRGRILKLAHGRVARDGEDAVLY